MIAQNNYYSSGSAIGTFSYGYNEDSQRSSASENNGGGSYAWDYNSLGQLQREARTGAAAYTNTYGYDNVGNRTSDNINGRVDTLTNDADDELKTFTNNGTSFNYGYDSNGNQTSRVWGVAYTLTYDLDNNLMHVSSASGTVYYAYDALGRRASRQVGGSVGTEYQYDGSQMLTETTGSGSSQYLWGPGGLVRRDGEWPLTDGLGSTRVVTNGSQGVTAQQAPDAYGQTVGSSGSTALPYLWRGSSGYRSDLDAGLIQVGARYYDRDSGRFITRDSDLDQAPYAYCDGDPINCTDPDGHQKKDPPKKTPPPTTTTPAPGTGGGGTSTSGNPSGTPGGGGKQTTGGAANPTTPKPYTITVTINRKAGPNQPTIYGAGGSLKQGPFTVKIIFKTDHSIDGEGGYSF